MNSPVEPLVSVIIPTYNRANFLVRAIQSVLDQTYTNWEVIVIDNHSDDDTDTVMSLFMDSRISYLKIHNEGVISTSRNFGIQVAKGELIAFLDSDDWWDSNKLAMQVPLFDDKEVGLVYANFWLVDERKGKNKSMKIAHSGILPEGKVVNQLMEEYVIGMLTMVLRRRALEGFDEVFDTRYLIISDFDLAIRLAVNWKLACVQKPIASYLFHGNNLSILKTSILFKELECWFAEKKKDQYIGPQSGLEIMIAKITYLKIMHTLVQGERFRAFVLFWRYPLGFRKLRLLVAIFMPLPILKALRT
jgi:glycosyltransferase involved in cell wall biosynthesis